MPYEKIPPEDKGKNSAGLIRGLSQVSQIGLNMIACVFIGVFFGRFLDSFFGTEPWLLLVFSFMGVAAGFKYLFDLSKRM